MAQEVKATSSNQGFFNKLATWQQKGCDKFAKHLVLVEKLGINKVRINKDDATWLKVVKFVSALLLALPVFAVFGAATLLYKTGCLIKSGVLNIKNMICKSEEKKEDENDGIDPAKEGGKPASVPTGG